MDALNAVSIHAPARGATSLQAPKSTIIISFNPRTREGCDIYRHQTSWRRSWFQSTHPRGVRHYMGHQPASIRMFQSTHPRGVRRPAECRRLARHRGFNPRTREGCDSFSFISTPPPLSFNPRTREGCDGVWSPKVRGLAVSIHAPARGATGFCEDLDYLLHVSIHAPARGATKSYSRTQ